MMDEHREASRPKLGARRFRAERGNGSMVEMEDDSQWEISPGHEVFIVHWRSDAVITIVPGGFPDYPYDLINPASGDRVPARYRGSSRTPSWHLIDH